MNNPNPGLVAYDTETYLLRPGLLAPPLVCLTWADASGGMDLLGKDDALEWWRTNIVREDLHWVGHNIAYDMGVMLAAAPDTAPAVFQAYADSRVHDTKIRECLLLNATGDYDNNAPSLAALTKKYLNRDRSAEKKGPDVWRLRYNELDGIPVDQWPDAARSYALDDAVDTLRVAMAQSARPFKVRASGRVVDMVRPDGSIQNEYEQVRADLALQLMTIWGMKVDQEAAQELKDQYQEEADRLQLGLVREGLKRPDGSTDTAAVKERIMYALTASADDHERAAVEGSVQRAKEAFEQEQADLVEAGERTKPLNWTPTREHKARVRAWKDRKYKIPTTASGQVKTGEDILETIDDPVIERLVQWKAADKRLSTYMEPLLQSAGRALTPGYGVLKRSGRTSSWGPNIQNFPRQGGERECFVPRDGWLFVAADYSTVELRAWSQVCLDLGIPSEMAKALQEGRDLHADLGAQLLEVRYSDMLRALDGKDGPEAKSRAKAFRQVAKPGNFGLPVGMGVGTFAESARKSYGIDFEKLGVDPQAVRAAWYERWTEARPYFNHVSDLLVTVGHKEVEVEDPDTGETSTELKEIRKCTIQHPRSGRVRGGCFFTDAANSYFQGMAADGAKVALFQVARECYADPSSELFGSRPVAFIHDEILMESPADRVQEAADRLVQVMVQSMEVYIPDIPILVEADIMDRWAKSAESQILEDGSRSIYWHGPEQLRSRAAELDKEARSYAFTYLSLKQTLEQKANECREQADELQAQLEQQYGVKQ